MKKADDLTRKLNDAQSGDDKAMSEIWSRLFQEIHQVAKYHMAREGAKHTLQPTALVNEVFLRLLGNKNQFSNRKHFMNVAAKVMRSILVDHARGKKANKRAGINVSFDESFHSIGGTDDADSLLALNTALEKLAEIDPRLSHLVELKFFGGLSIDEIAETMELSRATIKRDWITARVWLANELKKSK